MAWPATVKAEVLLAAPLSLPRGQACSTHLHWLHTSGQRVCCGWCRSSGKFPWERGWEPRDECWFPLSPTSLDPEVYVYCQGDDIIEGPWEVVRNQLILNVVSKAMQEGIAEGAFIPVALPGLSSEVK